MSDSPTVGQLKNSIKSGAVLRWGRGHVPPRFTCCPPQIRKIADRSDVISEVPKCFEIQIFRGSAPDPAGEDYSASPDPIVDGEWAHRCPSQEPHPALGPSGLVSTGLRV